MHSSQILAALLLAATPFVSAHGLISSVTGDLGGNGTGFGVAANGAQNEADVTIFRSSAGAFGATAVSHPMIHLSFPHYGTFLAKGKKTLPLICHHPSRPATSSRQPTSLP